MNTTFLKLAGSLRSLTSNVKIVFILFETLEFLAGKIEENFGKQ